MKLTDLRSILQDIPRFREKIFVISVDGAIVTSENFANILLDVAAAAFVEYQGSCSSTARPLKFEILAQEKISSLPIWKAAALPTLRRSSSL